ncbi:hypothetical protein POTOM_005967 [Populus tomentosa]|uniref:Uncharacterized protein n=1 Tax=Populus tomentosa TaxID=118781 RepID=A0A8X8AI26_POPTO|nr:hypothetical protein POTOM_005967 [Populus tomentosa]
MLFGLRRGLSILHEILPLFTSSIKIKWIHMSFTKSSSFAWRECFISISGHCLVIFEVNFLIHKGQRVLVVVHDATNDIVHDTFNIWFSLCCSSLDVVEEAQCLDNAIKKDEVVIMYDDGTLVILII